MHDSFTWLVTRSLVMGNGCLRGAGAMFHFRRHVSAKRPPEMAAVIIAFRFIFFDSGVSCSYSSSCCTSHHFLIAYPNGKSNAMLVAVSARLQKVYCLSGRWYAGSTVALLTTIERIIPYANF